MRTKISHSNHFLLAMQCLLDISYEKILWKGKASPVGVRVVTREPQEVIANHGYRRGERDYERLPIWLSRSNLPAGLAPGAQTRASPPHQAKNGLDGDPGVWGYVCIATLRTPKKSFPADSSGVLIRANAPRSRFFVKGAACKSR